MKIMQVQGNSCYNNTFSSVDNRENFMQGMERFIDAAEGKVYQAIILAESVAEEVLQTISRGYEQIYTQISPYAKNF